MKVRSILRVGAAVCLSGALAACSTEFYEPKTVSTEIEPGKVMSNTAALTHTFVRDGESTFLTCSQPPPDAAFDQGEAGEIAISLINLGGGDQTGEEEETEEVEMAGRTPAVLMTRELFFRACEFSQNYKLDKTEALELYNKTLESVTSVWATEAGNTTVTVGDTVSTSTTQGFTAAATTSITDAVSTSDTTSETQSITTSQ